ncbi:MAG: NHL repeat-containing protein [Desulfuromonadaceae bacterium]|nr:NHL repeat-containing protein [Desulfuromonas sp.]MDY0184422.1 NHL repeat-containing protein [Desulfuromonadaceae bacterium]
MNIPNPVLGVMSSWGKCPSFSVAKKANWGKSPSWVGYTTTVCALLGLVGLFLHVLAEDVFAQSAKGAHCVGTMDRGIMEQSLSYPAHIYYDALNDEVFITDSAHSRIVVCNSNYFPVYEFGTSQKNKYIGGMARINGKLSVVTREQSGAGFEVAVFDDAFLPTEPIFLSGYPEVKERVFLPSRVVQGLDGRIYIVSENGGPVYVFTHNGAFLHLLQPHDVVLGIREVASVKDVAVDTNGKLYLLSEERGRVYVYDDREIFLFKFGQKGGDRGKLARPRGIAVNTSKKEIYISDYLRHAVSIYTLQGEFVDEFGGKGAGKGWLYYPSDVAVDGKGHVLVADTFNHRIQAFVLP